MEKKELEDEETMMHFEVKEREPGEPDYEFNDEER